MRVVPGDRAGPDERNPLLNDRFDAQTSRPPRTPGERNIAALVEWNQRRSEARYPPTEARRVRSAGIVGAGAMGTSIAAAAISSNLRVVITDIRQEALDSLRARMAAELAGERECSLPQDPPEGDPLLQTTDDLAEVARCDLVLETVVEDILKKTPLLLDLERKLAPGAILASNTSTISIGRLAGRLSDPGRFCGIHFFQPVRRQFLVEVVFGPHSGRETLATAATFAQSLGKMPLVVPDGPAFLVNRLMMLYFSEGLQLVAEGAPIEQVEQVAVDFGMARGPMSLIDHIGLDVVLDCAWALADPMGGRMATSPLLVMMVKAGRLGRKSGEGFFRYAADGTKDANGKADPALAPMLKRWAAEPKLQDPETITARLFLPMLLEATRILAEGRLDDPRDVDLAVVFGFGFPPARGGLLYWADTLGTRRILEMLRPFRDTLGLRAEPTPLFMEMAAAGRRFYPDLTANGEEKDENLS